MIKKIFSALALALLLCPLSALSEDEYKTATFAGGCFWCMESAFDKIDGVLSTTSGYTGGEEKNPTYEEVSSGFTGHAEAIQVLYDPAKVDYRQLLQVFWHNIDPVAVNRQFCDTGRQYRSAIFFHDEEQRLLAEASRSELESSGKNCHSNRCCRGILAGGRISPGLLQEKSCPLQILPLHLRPG